MMNSFDYYENNTIDYDNIQDDKWIEQYEEIPYDQIYKVNQLPEVQNDAITSVISDILQEIIDENDANTDGDSHITSSFHAQSLPKITIQQYIQRLSQFFCCSQEVYILSLIYLDRLQEQNVDFKMNTRNIHRLLLVSLVVAAKFFDEQYYTNDYYRKVGGISLDELNKLELQFLLLINYRLYVTPNLFYLYREKLILSQDEKSEESNSDQQEDALEVEDEQEQATENESTSDTIQMEIEQTQIEEKIDDQKLVKKENLLSKKIRQKQLQYYQEYQPIQQQQPQQSQIQSSQIQSQQPQNSFSQYNSQTYRNEYNQRNNRNQYNDNKYTNNNQYNNQINHNNHQINDYRNKKRNSKNNHANQNFAQVYVQKYDSRANVKAYNNNSRQNYEANCQVEYYNKQFNQQYNNNYHNNNNSSCNKVYQNYHY